MDTHAQDNFFDDLPIDIDTLAALVEGDLGCQEADAVREQLLAHDPELAARIERMARDRVLLQTLGDVQPPPGLTESLIARLEREALLGLSTGDPLTDTLPISTLRTVRPSRIAGGIRWVCSGPSGIGLAMAASVLLLLGIGLQLWPRSPGGNLSPNSPIADSSRGTEEHTLAMTEGEETAAEPRVGGDPPAPPPAMTRTAQPLPIHDEPPSPDPAVFLTDEWDRVLGLLAEGRLLVRVQSADPEKTIAQLGRLAGLDTHPGEAWRLDTKVTDSITLAMETKFAPAAATDELHVPLVFAGQSGTADFSAAESAEPSTPPTSPLAGIYMADTKLDRAAMVSLRAALSLGNGQIVVFEELAEPLDLPRVLTPETVLWWDRPIRQWTKRVYVPIVVERATE